MKSKSPFRFGRYKWTGLFLASIFIVIFYATQLGEPTSKQIPPMRVGFIGDSITHGPKKGRNAVDVEMLSLGNNYVAVNRGVSGTTSFNWQPGHTLFDDALASFKAQNVRVVSIMLGTNDARTDFATSPAAYRKNIDAIVNALLSSGGITQVIVNYPPYAVPGTGPWKAVSVARLKAYMTQIDELTKRKGVALGDTTAFRYFQHHQGELVDGVHPGPAGILQLGKLWATAYEKIMSNSMAKELKLPSS